MTADLAHGSLHETLGRAGFALCRGTGTIAAAAATAEEARLLGIRTGDPLLVERRVDRRRARPADRGDRIASTRPTATASTCSSRSRRGDVDRTETPTHERAGRRHGDVAGRLVLDDRVVAGRIAIEDGWIAAVELDEAARRPAASAAVRRPGLRRRPRPRRGRPRRDGRPGGARRHGPPPPATRRDLVPADRGDARRSTTSSPSPNASGRWLPGAPADGAEPLGFNLEGPFLAAARRGAHDPAHLRVPADVPRAALEPLVDGPAA